jgi:hypothetical protein
MADQEEPHPVCGIVMPISSLDGCSEDHWAEVHDILDEAIEEAGFDANLVSNADDVGIIQKRIIQNLYDNPIVICDVSGKNPNVMFELGLRLAFDRPTIIIKDDKTSYVFDTAPIEHLEYPRDLRFSKIVVFKATLADKIKSTHQKASNDPEYTTFLKHFGEFKVAKIEKKEVPGQEFILDELRSLRLAIGRLDRRGSLGEKVERLNGPKLDICCGEGLSKKGLRVVMNKLADDPRISALVLKDHGGHEHLEVRISEGEDAKEIERSIYDSLEGQLTSGNGTKRAPNRGPNKSNFPVVS